MNTYEDLIQFLRNPVPEKSQNHDFFHRISVFLTLLLTCFMISFFLSIVIGMVYQSGLIENDYHAFDNIKDKPDYEIFLLAVILAPMIEEAIFRGPLTLFKSPWKLPFKVEGINEIRIRAFENPKVFQIAFYVFALAFGYIHLSNYQIDTQIVLFSPLLVAPQIVLGLIVGYIRIRFGFLWGVALHAGYNGILIALFLVAKDVVPQ
jgi:membrane protease YdiL (CAAX protease family)